MAQAPLESARIAAHSSHPLVSHIAVTKDIYP